jgi:hypothetical protein
VAGGGVVGGGVGLVVPGGLVVGVTVGLLVGLLVGLVVTVWLAVGCGLGELDVPVGFGLAEPMLVFVGLAVGFAEIVGFAEDDDELPVGVALADEEVLAEDPLGEPAGLNATSSRMAALGRVAQALLAIGGPAWRADEAANTSVLDARRT